MIKQLRRKFITVTMLLVAVMLLCVFVFVVHASLDDFKDHNLRMLKGFDRPADHLPENGNLPSHIPNKCFVLTKMPDGSYQLKTHEDAIPDPDTQKALFAMAEASSDQTGVFYQQKIRFYKLQNGDGNSIIFMDVSMELKALTDLGLNCLLIWFVVLVLFFPISWLLARAIAHPVELAMVQQQQFVADASHELKTPLTVILTNSELLQGSDYSPQDQRRFLDAIHTTAVQMRQLVTSLLDLARLDQGNRHRQYGTLDLSALAEECGMLFEPVYFEADRELVYEIEPELCLQGDEVRLRQLIDILLDNACKYSEAGTQVTLQLRRRGTRHYLLQVASRGQTLTSQQCRDIFKRFYRVDTVRTGSGSYGLGLSIAQQITREYRGRIWCEGKDGLNTFYIQLPTNQK